MNPDELASVLDQLTDLLVGKRITLSRFEQWLRGFVLPDRTNLVLLPLPATIELALLVMGERLAKAPGVLIDVDDLVQLLGHLIHNQAVSLDDLRRFGGEALPPG